MKLKARRKRHAKESLRLALILTCWCHSCRWISAITPLREFCIPRSTRHKNVALLDYSRAYLRWFDTSQEREKDGGRSLTLVPPAKSLMIADASKMPGEPGRACRYRDIWANVLGTSHARIYHESMVVIRHAIRQLRTQDICSDVRLLISKILSADFVIAGHFITGRATLFITTASEPTQFRPTVRLSPNALNTITIVAASPALPVVAYFKYH